MNTNPTISELVMVVVHYKDGNHPDTKIVPKVDVEKFIEATKKLHHSPGINPHSKLKTARATHIFVYGMEVSGPFWWSTPDLQQNYDPNGARIIGEGRTLQVIELDKEINHG